MRLIEIEPGQNEVVFSYQPRWFYFGVAISGVSLVVSGGWWIKKRELG
jgi:uncharacterized membrane protein YfhO